MYRKKHARLCPCASVTARRLSACYIRKSQITTIQDTLKPTYASILKNNTNVASNSINQNTNPTGERPTLQQKLQSFTSKHSRSRSKSPTRKASKTN